MIRKNKIFQTIITWLLVTCLLIGFIHYLMQSEIKCSYDAFVEEISLDTYQEADDNSYHYSIDEISYMNDYFYLTKISGWAVARSGKNFTKGTEALLLRSKNYTYKIDIIEMERPDVSFASTKEDTKVGFFTYIPYASLKRGSYSLGILININDTSQIIWTDSTLWVD